MIKITALGVCMLMVCWGCRVPREFKISDGEEESGCGFIEVQPLKNDIKKYHYPDPEFILETAVRLKLSNDQVKKSRKSGQLPNVMRIKKEALRDSEIALHDYLLQQPDAESTLVTEGNKHLKKVAVFAEEMEKRRMDLVKTVHACYTQARDVLTDAQRKKLKTGVSGLDSWPDSIQ